MTKSVNTRELINEILIQVLENDQYSNKIINAVLDKYNYIDKKDKSFIKIVAEGTIENLIQIDYIINYFSKIKVKKMKPAIRTILRSAVYQIKYMDSIPDRAVCDEAVKQAGRAGYSGLKGFVNGVLRNICRNIENIEYPDKKDFTKYCSVKYSMPEWIVDKWINEYSKDITENILEGIAAKKRLTARVNENKISANELIKVLKQENVSAKKGAYLSECIEITDMNGIRNIKAFNEGLLYIQDVSSMLVAHIADPRQGDYCIDICAAPGGKSLHLAERMNGTGIVDARDVSLHKTQLINENIKKSTLSNIKSTVMDATDYDRESENMADILIADVPCSGLGVMERKSDIKYRINPENIEKLVKLQREILSNVSHYVKPNGILIYSTCTINREENEENLRWFIDNFPFETETIEPYLPKELHNDTTSKGYLQLLPGINKADGFFVARMRRKS